MSATQPQTDDAKRFDDVYDNITKLYSHAENLLKIVENAEISNQDSVFAVIEPLIAEIENSTNLVAADFAEIIEKGELPTNAMKRRVSTNLRNIIAKIEEYREIIKNIEVQDE